MRVIFILLFPLLALPIGISYGYSIYPEPTRFLLSLAALAGALMLLGHLSALSSRRGMRRSILAGGIAIIACFQLARVVCYYFQGESFNTRFFFHLELDNALLAWRAYLLLLTSCLAWLTTVLSLAWFAPIPKPAPSVRPGSCCWRSSSCSSSRMFSGICGIPTKDTTTTGRRPPW